MIEAYNRSSSGMVSLWGRYLWITLLCLARFFQYYTSCCAKFEQDHDNNPLDIMQVRRWLLESRSVRRGMLKLLGLRGHICDIDKRVWRASNNGYSFQSLQQAILPYFIHIVRRKKYEQTDGPAHQGSSKNPFLPFSFANYIGLLEVHRALQRLLARVCVRVWRQTTTVHH